MDSESDPFADEPTLPQLPALARDPAPQDASKRKRRYPFRPPSAEGVPSSDIGVFSSDDDPALDNYVQARQKRRYRGTWYDHNHMMSDAGQDGDDSMDDVVPETPKAKARGSQSHQTAVKGVAKTVGGAGHPPPTPPSSNPVQGHAFTPNRGLPSSQGFSSSQAFSPGQRFASSQGLPSSQGYSTESARKQSALLQEIERHIDRGNRVIDLSSHGLDDESISVDTFRPLVDLKLVPRVKARKPAGYARDPLTTSKDGYLHRESEIFLIMANNRLTRVPGALFSVENLVDLSLRHNQLTELPPAIARCRNLQSLNISFNRLRWLPFEIVQRLPMLRILNVYGNDFFEPEPPRSSEAWQFDNSPLPVSGHLMELLSARLRVEGRRDVATHPEDAFTRLSAWYLGRGAVQYTDTTGRIYSAFRVPSAGGRRNQVQIQDASEQPGPLARHQGESRARPGSNREALGSGRVPSLVEFCARSLAQSGRPEDLVGDMSSSDPDILATVVAAAAQSRYRDGQRCAICGKPFVIPRSQWIEFYCHGYGFFFQPARSGLGGERAVSEPGMSAPLGWDEILEKLIPCLRSGCSWKCVPYQTELRPRQRVPLDL